MWRLHMYIVFYMLRCINKTQSDQKNINLFFRRTFYVALYNLIYNKQRRCLTSPKHVLCITSRKPVKAVASKGIIKLQSLSTTQPSKRIYCGSVGTKVPWLSLIWLLFWNFAWDSQLCSPPGFTGKFSKQTLRNKCTYIPTA